MSSSRLNLGSRPQRGPVIAAGGVRRPTPTLTAAILDLQGSAGTRAVSALLEGQAEVPGLAVQRLLTNATPTWGPIEGTTGQGTHVVAIVGPGVLYGSGPSQTVPNFRPFGYTRLFSSASKQAAYCQGHLLNDNLGGPGDPAVPHAAENLTAFPQKPTNGDHLQIAEKLVKDGTKAGKWLRYEVQVGYSTDSMPRLQKRLGLAGALFDQVWQA